MKFRKKPVVIEATQWFKNGDHPEDYAKDREGLENGVMRTWTGAEAKALGWEGDVVRYFRRPDVSGDTVCKHCGKAMHEHGWIDTLEGGHIVCPGDWIIKGVNGEFYPCKPDIFVKTYEDADAKPTETRAPVVTDDMVSRFLSWRLPATFNPDGGVTFDKKDYDPNSHWWPVGTNILNADEARAMLEHVLAK